MTRLHDPDAPDPPVGEFGTSELGAMLCESRILLGCELEDVAAELRIRLTYLQAIEDGRLDDLPGTTYATGFLRAYADFLGLDGEDLVRQFKAEHVFHIEAVDHPLAIGGDMGAGNPGGGNDAGGGEMPYRDDDIPF